MSCKGICKKYRAKKPSSRSARYGSGQKRCQGCEIYIKWAGRYCPCCGIRLRATPRNRVFKAKLRKLQHQQQQQKQKQQRAKK